jgi:hypothetical protein
MKRKPLNFNIPSPEDLPESETEDPTMFGTDPALLAEKRNAESDEEFEYSESEEDERPQSGQVSASAADDVDSNDDFKSVRSELESFDGEGGLGRDSPSPFSTPGSSGVSRERLQWQTVSQYPHGSMSKEQIRKEIAQVLRNDLAIAGVRASTDSSSGRAPKQLGDWKFKRVSAPSSFHISG